MASEADLASRTMLNYLINYRGFEPVNDRSNIFESKFHEDVKLYVSKFELIHFKDVNSQIQNSKAVIFLSKHESSKKRPALTCHSTGNFMDNKYGGRSKELGLCFPSLQKDFIKRINNKKSLVPDYEICIEATHHGPTSLSCPILFVEIGSSYPQWTDINAASLVCDTILEVINFGLNCDKIGIGIGGPHYPDKFNKLLIESDYALAAIASKYNLSFIDHAMLTQMYSKSIEKVTHIVVDRKGLGEEKSRIMNLVGQFGLEILYL
jgi:D-aminoacyl-tRNA deacylase